MHTHSVASIRIQGELSQQFFQITGVKQGSVLGSLMQIVYINDLLEELDDAKLPGVAIGSKLNCRKNDTIEKEKVNKLCFVDDLLIMSQGKNMAIVKKSL